MGKKIKRASIWTCRPILFCCHKVITLVFAVFCVVSGLFANTTVTKQKFTFKGTALIGKDSTIAKNMKLYLCGVGYPVYGMSLGPSFFRIDSTVTNPDGSFEISYEDYPESELAIVNFDSERDKLYNLFIADKFPEDGTIYLRTTHWTGIKENKRTQSTQAINVTRGKRVSITISDWSLENKRDVNIVNTLGHIVETPVISENGELVWNTGRVTPGLYFVNIFSMDRKFSLRVCVK